MSLPHSFRLFRLGLFQLFELSIIVDVILFPINGYHLPVGQFATPLAALSAAGPARAGTIVAACCCCWLVVVLWLLALEWE